MAYTYIQAPKNVITCTTINTDDTQAHAALIWCDKTATNTAPTIAVSATTGDLVATYDGSTAPSDFYEAGGTAGTIDVSDANANTFGEVEDIVNQADGWHMKLTGAIRSEASTVAQLVTRSATKCMGIENAVPLYWDTSAVDHYRVAVTAAPLDEMGYVNEVHSVAACCTCSGTPYLWVLEVPGVVQPGVAPTATDYKVLFKYLLTSTTAVDFDYREIFTQSAPGHRLIVSMSGSSDISSAYLIVRHRTRPVKYSDYK